MDIHYAMLLNLELRINSNSMDLDPLKGEKG